MLWVIGFSLITIAGAVAGAGLMLLFPDRMRRTLIPCFISYSTGTLLGAAFLGMIPTGLKTVPAMIIMGMVLAGIVLFFILEKVVIWRHCHDETCHAHGRAGPLILVGDAFHNFVDGAVIAAAFLTSVPLGIAAALAVIAHEIPQEVGDFAILLDSGYSRLRALALNTLSATAMLPGGVLAYFWLAETRGAIPYILALSAASFIYIAIADLIPSLHRHTSVKAAVRQIVLILAGIGTIALFRFSH